MFFHYTAAGHFEPDRLRALFIPSPNSTKTQNQISMQRASLQRCQVKLSYILDYCISLLCLHIKCIRTSLIKEEKESKKGKKKRRFDPDRFSSSSFSFIYTSTVESRKGQHCSSFDKELLFSFVVLCVFRSGLGSSPD